MSFPRYESYKESGVEWLGEVPEHWEVISIKWLSPVQRGASPRPIDDPKYFDEDGEYAWVRIADVSASDGVLRETTQKLSVLGSSLSVKIAPGELFVSIAGTVGKPCISEIKACIHDGFVYFPRLKINPKLLYRIFESETCYGGLGKWGTQLNLNTDTIGSIRVALPPQKELSLVLSFLDRETAKIDALIAEQQRLIELLKEKRQAVISHAITTGLNPDVPMKDSGVEWLGEVPEHWDVKRLKEVCEIFPSNVDKKTYENEMPVLLCNYTDVYYNEKITSQIDFMVATASAEQVKKFTLREGDTIITKDSETADDIAIAAYVPQNMPGVICGYHLSMIRPREATCGAFMKRLFDSVYVKSCCAVYANGLTRVGLGQYALDNLEMPFPPKTEQAAIAAFLDQETTKLDTLTTEAKTAITLLQERRAALISAAVTGKIDVRGLVAAKTEVKAGSVPC
jgi:type I restriction enzyme, S subunit